jgi:hypothetical protein
MSEHETETALRDQLSALVADRPAVVSPAPLVIAKVRRSRRRRAVAGALAVAVAVTGGTLLGVDRAHRPVLPAKPLPLCQVSLPAAWGAALTDPANALPKGMTLVAAAPDGSRVFVQQGNQILQLTDGFRTRKAVMTLPPIPPRFADNGRTWTVTGSFDGSWLVVALASPKQSALGLLGLYAWSPAAGVTRTLLATSATPALEINTWVAGSGRVGWETQPFNEDGAIMDGTVRSHLATLSSGAVVDPGGDVRAFLGDTVLVLDKDNKPRTVSLAGGDPVPVPGRLSEFLRTHTSWGSMTGSGAAFSWGGGSQEVKDAKGQTVGQGPASWDIWWQGTPSVVQVVAPKGYFVGGLNPIGADYAVATLVPDDKPIKDVGDSGSALIDLRSHSSTPLTAAQETALDNPARSMNLAGLPRLPGC